MRRLVIYYRPSLFEEELEAALDSGFYCTPNITDLTDQDIVIPRYTTLPFYKDVYREFDNIDCQVVNPIWAHEFMADLFKWYPHFKAITPKTWGQYDMVKLPEDKAYVLKGATNSKKAYWNTHMYAGSKKEAIQVFSRLVDDGLVGNQEIAIREYVPLKTFMYGINGMPVTREFRYFFFNGEIVSRGFYWQNYADELTEDNMRLPEHKYSFTSFLRHITDTLDANSIEFVCVDIAQTVTGEWLVVELNDGTMAGLSCIDPKQFYTELYERAVERYSI